MRLAAALLLLVLVTLGYAVQGAAGPYRVDLSSDPNIVPVGRAKLLVKLTDATGRPVSGATVTILAQMPGMAMGERETEATPTGQAGTYSASVTFGMAGRYDVSVTILGPLGSAGTTLALSTGEPTQGDRQTPFVTYILWAVVVLGVAALFWRMRKTGQSVGWRSVFSRQVILPLLLLAATLAVAVWAVNTFRRPGSMTPLEAQTMEMNVPAPEGDLPVRLARAELRPFSATVFYNGQAVGFVEQDVVPRVTGMIVSMPFYVGSKVKKGQVVVRLDASQTDPMVREKGAGVQSAIEGLNVASMEYQQALNGVAEARAELTMTRGEVAEARATQDAAQQSKVSAESAVQAAEADARAMQAELRSAQADQTYQQQDLQRTQSLYDQKAVSKDEWQRAQAEARKADAAVERARENVLRAQAAVQSARSEVKKSDAEVTAARRKVTQAEARVRAKEASVRTSESAARAAKGKIGQSKAGVSEAAAGLQGATTQRGYSDLRAEVDGVVTDRVASPGTVVSPGQVVLRIAQVSPIRLQANVPESDLARIRTGAPARVLRRGANEDPLLATVTSVAPSVDANSRTGVVEVVYANREGRFVPGQYVSMEITVGRGVQAVVVPTDSVQSRDGRDYVWIAAPLTDQQFSVARQEVEVIGRAGDMSAVKTGVRAGQQVVLSPPLGMTTATRVTSASPTDRSPANQTIEITESGYSPASIIVPANKAFKVTFIRRDDKTCGTEVIFPELGIRKALPLNKPVTIEIPPQPAGKEVKFTCPMDMLNGKAVAK